MKIIPLLTLTFHTLTIVQSFAPSNLSPNSLLRLSSASTENENLAIDEEAAQWELFRKHHAKGSWKGIWTTYDYIGDVMDETVASVNYYIADDGDVVEQNLYRKERVG